MKYTFYLAYPKEVSSSIMVALRDKSRRITFSLGITTQTQYWDKKQQRIIGSKDARFLNEKIAVAQKAMERSINYGELDNLSIDEVANIYRKEMGLEVKEVKKEILFMPFYYMWAHTSFGKHNATKATSYHYRVFKEFLGRIEPTFDDINYNLYVRFISYLQAKEYKLNMQGTFIKDIKAAMNEAYKRGLHTNIAYQSFEKPSEQVTTIALTSKEVEMIYNAELSEGFEKARDLFIIGCYTGLRFSDYSRLTKEDADKDFLVKIQQKTKNEICIPLHPIVRKILKKWGGSPDISQQKMNIYIKSICAQLGINELIEVKENGKIIYKQKWEMVSSHTARRTAATNLLLSGASIHDVMRFLGHSSVTQTETYLRISAKETAKILAKNKFFSE